MGKMMKSAPVFFTVAQVRFNPILSLASYIPAIQEHFRRNGFPDFKKVVMMTFNLSPLVQEQRNEAQAPAPVPIERYVFSNLDNTMNFILEQSSIAFQATEYQTFEVFGGHLLQGLELLNKTVVLSFIERIGVRYLDAVMPRENETLEQYLIPEVMGLHGKLKGQAQYSFSETQTEGPDGFVVSRTVIQRGQIGFPPDLIQMMSLKMQQKFQQFTGAHAIIDTDAFLMGRIAFDLAEAERKLHTLHEKTHESFRETVTEYAISVWE
ncbi:MAG: TIGR04255 family protein [Acidobacteriia bacterium]|nr:TIGR04255 family protein [Terriglobia bacterium]